MPYTYKCLSQEEQDEILVTFLKAQEMDLYCHQINLERYDAMLKALPDGEFRSRIQQLRDETESRIAEVTSILEATVAQLPPPDRLQAAVARVTQKEAGAREA